MDDVWIRQAEQHDVKVVSLSPARGRPRRGRVLRAAGRRAEHRDLRGDLRRHLHHRRVRRPGLRADRDGDRPRRRRRRRTVTFPTYAVVAGNYLEIAAETRLAGDTDPANDRRHGYDYAYTQPRVPHALLVTCWDCSGCPEANTALDAYLAAGHEDDTALMRVHCWWPGGGDDPMYLANVEQATALVEGTPTGSDYAPHLWLDGYVDAGADGAAFAAAARTRRRRPAPR